MISLHHVSKKYETPAGAFAASRDIDVRIRTGEFVGVVGNQAAANRRC
jgi:ABC-type methionine transport system ATPase subunit